MTTDERSKQLKRLRDRIRAGELRERDANARDLLGALLPLLNFNGGYYTRAQREAHILTGGRFSSDFLENAQSRLDLVLGEAITELEHSLTIEAEDPVQPSDGLVTVNPTQAPAILAPTAPAPLTDENSAFWLFVHGTNKTRMSMVLSMTAVVVLCYLAGRSNLINQIVDLIQKTIRK